STYDKTADAAAGTLTVSYSELAGGVSTITVTFVDTRIPDEILDLITVGDGEFFIDASGGPEYSANLNAGDSVSNFVITPAPGWMIGSVILVAGDGTAYDKTDDALSGTLTVSYDELASGANTITVTFTEVPVIPDDEGSSFPWWILLFGLIFLLIFLDDDDEEVYGKVTWKGRGIAFAKISYTLNGTSGTVTTDKDGDYSIPVAIGDDIAITEVTKGRSSVSGLPAEMHIVKERTRVDLKF
ncbi:MAG: hypothetical protein LBH69_03695, partial [Methanomassiliicoccaceae archaeon]|nr:hypothetical protein [Methanomassiliicoccaceae archaeon]